MDRQPRSLVLMAFALCTSGPSVMAGAAEPSLAGRWIAEFRDAGMSNSDVNFARVTVSQQGDAITVNGPSWRLDGSSHDGQIQLREPHPFEGERVWNGRLQDGRIVLVSHTPVGDYEFTARREQPRTAAPRTHDFAPQVFHRLFRADVPPALRLNPGDTVRTWTLDATGKDSKGVQRSAGGNPQTGPFFVEGALPGDTLVVHLRRIRLNRASAVTTAQLAHGTLLPFYASQLKPPEFGLAFWELDAASQTARLKGQPSEKLKTFTVPLRPFLGGIGVAPEGGTAVRTNGLGEFGGNLDYNRLVEGSTLYLPVFHPGALLFVGDGHAAQGDGELAGNALETSMDVEFTVDVIPGRAPRMPRAEDGDFRMAMGIAGSLQEALQQATTNMARWLEEDYGLNRSEVASVLGTGLQFDIAEVVDGDVNVVARLGKTLLQPIPRRSGQTP